MNHTALTAQFERHPVTSYINSLTSDSSKRSMLSALKSVFALALQVDPREIDPLVVYEFNWVEEMSPDRVKSIKAALLKKYSRRMAAKCLAAIKGVIGAMLDDTSLVSKPETYMRLQRAKAVKGISTGGGQKAGRKLTEGEILALARVCADDQSPSSARDDAILGLAYTQGPRISELVGLQLSDYDPDTGDIVILGKGNKTRTIRAANSVKDSLDEWLELRGDEAGPLFCRVRKDGEITIKPLSTTALAKVLKRRGSEAGVKPFTCHDLRRSFLTNGWAAGIPGPYLQKIAGHSSLSTTSSYDRSDVEAALKSSERLHYPSARRQ